MLLSSKVHENFQKICKAVGWFFFYIIFCPNFLRVLIHQRPKRKTNSIVEKINWKNLTLNIIKFQMTKIIFFTSCQSDAVEMMRSDIYLPIETVSSPWPDFRLTCAMFVFFSLPPSQPNLYTGRNQIEYD